MSNIFNWQLKITIIIVIITTKLIAISINYSNFNDFCSNFDIYYNYCHFRLSNIYIHIHTHTYIFC